MVFDGRRAACPIADGEPRGRLFLQICRPGPLYQPGPSRMLLGRQPWISVDATVLR